MRDRKGVDLDAREVMGRNREEQREGNCNQDMLCEKKISIFN